MLMLTALLLTGCARTARDRAADAVPIKGFKPYVIADSSKIITYPNGLKIYTVEAGPGDYPVNGIKVKMHYYGMLDDGTVFDDSYSRGLPLEFSMGSASVIDGITETVKKVRLGSKVIAIIPSELGYGDGKGKDGLPPKIPANARLTFHLDLLGSF